MTYLDLEDLLHIARRTIGNVQVRDVGLLAAAAGRPRAWAFGADVYPELLDKAGALTQSLARDHPLVDGNKRLAVAALLAFLGLNGLRLTLTNDQAYDLIIEVATGVLDDVSQLATRLAAGTEPAPR
ncbi:MAG: type II toxin-antitoxin system death-on-curing family toxin [Actinobacteria bacterium]|nr:type II toxin-antitoxin system death-on-curing family toxin [Actinomycetota bacterium]MCA1720660.1 type II toxin-antitoxin system death-on-curing family toxin [Actinomycetota bacterium]